jgi:hypothetical protein
MNSKGMEMAIQIFIVLFVLLAVSMLVLQLVSEQFSERGQDLEEQIKKDELRRKVNDARNECRELCNGNSMEELVKFCIKSFDLTPSGTISYSDKENILPGFAVCTDKVYCAQLVTDCSMGSSQVTMDSCKEIICNYWSSFGIEEPALSAKLKEFVQPGKCFEKLSEEEKQDHWFNVFFGTINAEDLNCS